MKITTRCALAIAVCASTLALAAECAAAPSDATVTLSPEQRTDAETFRRFLDDSLHSSNLRLRVMTGRMLDSTDDTSPGRTRIPIDALAESARGSTDPMVLALLVDPCANDRLTPRPTCDAVELARRWTIADTQNQLAWLTLSAALRARRDPAGARAAFERSSTASMWHEYFDEGSRVVAAAIPGALGGRARLATLQLAQSISAMELVPYDAASAFYFLCKDASLRDACVRIADTVVRDGGSLFDLQIAIDAAKRAGVDAQAVESRRRALDALLGASLDEEARDASGSGDASELADAIERAERRIAVGELGSLRAKFADSGLGESASAHRWRQHMAALVRQMNATREASDAP